jgi:CDP-diacylglycerol--glycerol-3-phosphate 3-phosphatidyltransferase
MNGVLNRELFLITAFGLLALVLSFLWLLPVTSKWQLLPALAVFGFVCQRLWQFSPLNRRDEQSPSQQSLGAANRLTVLRGWLIAVCAGYVGAGNADGSSTWLPAACYTIAALLDAADGVVARRSNSVTLLGTRLDTSFDALGLLIAPIVAVGQGKLHPSYLLVSAAYYLFVGGLHWRRSHGLPVSSLRPSKLRRLLAGLQMGLCAVALWPPIDAVVSQVAGVIFMVPLLVNFWRDWRDVSAMQ